MAPMRRPTSSCTPTPPSPSSTAPRPRRSWPPPPPRSATRPSRSPTTTGSGARWSSPTPARALGVRADHRRRADRRPDGRGDLRHLTLLVESAAGYRNLCRLLTAAHAHTRDNTAAQRRPAVGDAGAGRGARRGARLPLRLRPRRRACRGLRARRDGAGRAARRGACSGPSAASASGSSCSGPTGATTAPATAGSPRSPSGSASPAWRPATSTAHDRRRARLQDAFVAVGLGETLEESEPQRRGNSQLGARLAGGDGGALRRAPRGGRRDRAPRRAAALRPHRRSSATATPAPRTRRRPRAGRALPASGSIERYARPARDRARRERRLERGAGDDPRPRPLRLLPPPPRPARAGPRGRGRGARAAARPARVLPPGPRPRLQRQLDRLLPDRPLPHRPGRERTSSPAASSTTRSTSMPDIDLDFPRDIREVLIPRVHERYGADRSALVAAFPTYRPRGVVRDLGKALGLPPAEIEQVAKTVGFHERAGRSSATSSPRSAPSAPPRRAGGRCSGSAPRRWACPATPPSTPGGMVISTRAADRRLPGRAGGDGGAPDRPVGQGLLRRRRLPQDRPAGAGDALRGRALRRRSRARRAASGSTSRGSPSTTPRPSTRSARPRPPASSRSRAARRCRCCRAPCRENLDDLTVQVALVRPGPIQGGAVHPYIERRKRQREDPTATRSPTSTRLLERVLEDTLGTIVYQEQVLEVAIALAGFTSAEAREPAAGDEPQALRRGDRGAPPALHRRRRARRTAPRGELAERIWDKIQGFSGFGFPKAHSAAFGLLAYQSAWLRVHRAPEFLCALLNEQPMGFYPPDSLVHEAQRRGIRIAAARRQPQPRPLPRRAACEGGARIVRIGLGYVKGVREEEMEALVAERERSGPYGGVADLASRSGAGLASLERLAWAGALDAIPAERRCGDAPPRRSGRSAWSAPARGGGDGTQLALPLEPPRGAGAGAAGRVGRADRRLPLDRDGPRRAPDGADAPRPRPGDRCAARELDADRGRQRGRGRRHGRRPPAPRDRQGHRLHAARGRARHRQPGRPAAASTSATAPLVRTAPLLRARGRLERREGIDQRPRLRGPGDRSSARRSARTAERRPAKNAQRASWPSPSCAPSPPPATASAAAGADASARANPQHDLAAAVARLRPGGGRRRPGQAKTSVDLDLELAVLDQVAEPREADRVGLDQDAGGAVLAAPGQARAARRHAAGTETRIAARAQRRQRALAVGAGEVDHGVEVGDAGPRSAPRGSRSSALDAELGAATRPARRGRWRRRWRRGPRRSAPRGGRRRRRRRGPGRRRRTASAIVSTTICQAVSPASGSAAASSWDSAGGLAAKWREGAVTYSA